MTNPIPKPFSAIDFLAESQLKELQSIYATAPVGLAALDRDLRFVRVNDRLAEMNGIAASEHIGKTLREIVPQLAPAAEPLFRQVMETGQPIVNVEIVGETVAQPGVPRVWIENFSALLAEDGSCIGVNVVVEEITARKQLERRREVNFAITQILAESPSIDEAMPRILQTIGETLGWELGDLWTLDSDANVLRCLNSWCNRPPDVDKFIAASYGRTFIPGTGLPGRAWTSLKPVWVPDIIKDTNFPRVSVAVEVGLHTGFAFPIVFGQKLLCVMEFFSRDIREQDHALLAMFESIGSQIGQFMERKHAEEALRQSEERLASELAAMSRLHALSARLLSADELTSALDDVLENAMITCGADFGNIQLYNPQIEALEIVVQRGFRDDFLEHFRTVRLEEGSACAQATKTGERIIIEDVELDPGFEPHRRIAASAGYRAVQSTPLKTHQSVVGMLSTHFRMPHQLSKRDERFLDLYARHAADLIERLRFEQALKQADRRKDEFLATLAHELRNPLAPISNAVQMLKSVAPLHRDVVWNVEIIERQTEQIVRLLDDLLDVSRITRNNLELRKNQITLESVVQSAVETSRPVIDDARHELTVVLPAEPVYLDADPVRLAQVFSNLLNNAAKYTPAGGRIRVSASRQGREVVVSVRDSGIGIVSDMLPHIFEMFSQTKRALERSQGGLGIGLWLVKTLLDMHGGSVEARSDGHDKGSEFTVRLPLVTKEIVADGVAPIEDEQWSGRKYRVLIVDDRQVAADILAKLLRKSGHEVHTAYSGEEAIAAAEKLRPEVILLDLGMPNINGYDVCRHIRKQPWGKGIYIVALTGWGQEDDRRRSAEAGFNCHLVKPVRSVALLKMLAAIDSMQ